MGDSRAGRLLRADLAEAGQVASREAGLSTRRGIPPRWINR